VGSFSSMEISASGLSAQRLRMDLISNNIANANTTRTAEGGPYKRLQTVFMAKTDGLSDDLSISVGKPMGVETPQVVADAEPAKLVYDPGHPDANAQGYVAMPNVNMVQEMADMISATRAYEANVTAMNSAKSMAMKALEIGRG
jgi:flagellar basal-body rod protein FlgC